MANPLKSTLLKNNVQLNLALKNAPPLLLGARGAGVKQVQKALKQLGFAMSSAFPAHLEGEPDGIYTKETRDAVIELQRTRLFPKEPWKWDGEAGAETLPALDDLLAKGAPVPPTPASVTIVPFTATTPMILIAIYDNPRKSDLNTSDPPVPPLTTAEQLAVTAIQSVLSYEFLLEDEAQLELFTLAGSLGVLMFTLFKIGLARGVNICFPPWPGLAPLVEGTPSFNNLHNAVRLEFETLLKKQFAAGKVDVTALAATTHGTTPDGRETWTNLAGIKTPPDIAVSTGSGDRQVALHGVIGGQYQGGVVTLKAFAADPNTATYTATLEYTLLDHFGIDNSDVIPSTSLHGSPGQVAIWILQHKYHPGHNPYVTTVIIEKTVSGSLK